MMSFTSWILFFMATVAAPSGNTNKNAVIISDGVHSGSSVAQYADEPYVGKVTIEIDNHKIVNVQFQIIDTLNKEVFGSDYEKHFPDNELYRQQCRNDWKGVQHYPQELLKKQVVDSVDAVSGATWSYNIFKASVTNALKE